MGNTNLNNILDYKRASLACAARLADTKCLPEAPFGSMRSHCLIIREIASINMSIVVLKSISLKKSPILSILKFLMFKIFDDDVITVMSRHFLMIVASYVRYVSIQILLKFMPSISYNG